MSVTIDSDTVDKIISYLETLPPERVELLKQRFIEYKANDRMLTNTDIDEISEIFHEIKEDPRFHAWKQHSYDFELPDADWDTYNDAYFMNLQNMLTNFLPHWALDKVARIQFDTLCHLIQEEIYYAGSSDCLLQCVHNGDFGFGVQYNNKTMDVLNKIHEFTTPCNLYAQWAKQRDTWSPWDNPPSSHMMATWLSVGQAMMTLKAMYFQYSEDFILECIKEEYGLGTNIKAMAKHGVNIEEDMLTEEARSLLNQGPRQVVEKEDEKDEKEKEKDNNEDEDEEGTKNVKKNKKKKKNRKNQHKQNNPMISANIDSNDDDEKNDDIIRIGSASSIFRNEALLEGVRETPGWVEGMAAGFVYRCKKEGWFKLPFGGGKGKNKYRVKVLVSDEIGYNVLSSSAVCELGMFVMTDSECMRFIDPKSNSMVAQVSCAPDDEGGLYTFRAHDKFKNEPLPKTASNGLSFKQLQNILKQYKTRNQ